MIVNWKRYDMLETLNDCYLNCLDKETIGDEALID